MEQETNTNYVLCQKINFSEYDLSLFRIAPWNCGLSVLTDITKPKSPLWVNFVILQNFIRLHIHYWQYIEKTEKSNEKINILNNVLHKTLHVYNLAIRHVCIMNYYIDIRKLLNITIASKIENLHL